MGNRRVPFLIATLGVVIASVLVGETVAHVTSDGISALFVVSFVTTAPFILACFVGPYWMVRSELPAERFKRVGAWTVGGFVGFLVLNVLTIITSDPVAPDILVGWLRWAAALGAGTGTVIGISEARAINRAVRAERARVRADEAETREELLAYLHNLLRHKVRNAVNAIDGHASLLAERPADGEQYLAAIHRQTSELHQITREVRTFLEASNAEGTHEAVDLCAVIREEIGALEGTVDAVELDLECEEDVLVRADELLNRAVRNLLLSATLHDPDEVTEVHVSVRADATTVTVSIEVVGSGLQAADHETLFDLNRGGTPEQGLGLPLARLLVERYGGEVSLRESGPEGTRIVVELPRANSMDHREDITTQSAIP